MCIHLFNSEVAFQWTVSTWNLLSRCPVFKSRTRGHCS